MQKKQEDVSRASEAGLAKLPIFLKSYQPLTYCIGHGSSSPRHVQLDEDVAQVTIGGTRADDQDVGHFPVGVPFRDQPQHFQLAFRELLLQRGNIRCSRLTTSRLGLCRRVGKRERPCNHFHALTQRVHHRDGPLHAIFLEDGSRLLTQLIYTLHRLVAHDCHACLLVEDRGLFWPIARTLTEPYPFFKGMLCLLPISHMSRDYTLNAIYGIAKVHEAVQIANTLAIGRSSLRQVEVHITLCQEW